MKKIISLFSVVFLLTAALSAPIYGVVVSDKPIINVEDASQGLVTLKVNPAEYNRLVVLIEKNGTRYQYFVNQASMSSSYPLQMGNGTYLIRLLENIEGNKYREVIRKTVSVWSLTEKSIYTQSISEINWSDESLAVKKAKELVNSQMSDLQKVEAIYKYVVANFKYDYDKAATVTSGYVPKLDLIFESKKGICYDYSAIFAAMTRSVGVPTKLVKGYTDNIQGQYHAWNEVLLDGEWQVIDTTYDAAFIKAGYSVDQYKLAEAYAGSKFY